jgi:TOTE conflict system, Archaeo-Eukaryotic Primase domain
MEIAWPPHWSRMTACAPKMSAFESFCVSVKSVHWSFRLPKWRPSARQTTPLAADEKIRLFRSLFRGREDIYAVRWEVKNGKAGYSPAHIKKGWFASKAEARANREFLPLTDAVIRDHLSRKIDGRRLSLAERRDVLVPSCGFRQDHLAG